MGAASPAWPGPSSAEDEAQRGDQLQIQQLPLKLLFCALHNVSVALVNSHLPSSALSKAIGHVLRNPQECRVWNGRMSCSLWGTMSSFCSSGLPRILVLKFYFSSQFLQSPFRGPVPAEDAQETGSPQGKRARWPAWVPARFRRASTSERGRGMC